MKEACPIYAHGRGGQPFGTGQLQGRVWIADFFFTNCPGPCPRMSTLMSEIQRKTKDIGELRIVSITVDPERDTPEAMKAYGARYGAIDGRWHFLTGPQETLNRIARQDFKLFDVDGSLQHSTRFALIDRRGTSASSTRRRRRHVLPVAGDIRRLIKQSDTGGNVSDSRASQTSQGFGCPTPKLVEDYRFLAVEQDAMLQMPADGAREHGAFEVATFLDEIRHWSRWETGRHPARSAPRQLFRHVMAGGSDELHAPFKGGMVGRAPTNAGRNE